MCGITGWINNNGVDLNHLMAMNQTIQHRGPDDEGFILVDSMIQNYSVLAGKDTPRSVLEANLPYTPRQTIKPIENAVIGLGHRRLSIVDVSAAGHQPMSSNNQNYWLVYNGEIYNYLELRESLKELGHQFLSNTDTEVILASWQEWGVDALKKFNGMFAFLLLDFKKKTLFAARDRFGIKPLYYHFCSDGGLAFASEIKQFSKLPDWKPKINGQRAYDYLTWSSLDHTSETMFDNVYQLRPGQYLELSLDKALQGKYCSPENINVYNWYELNEIPFDGDFSEAGDSFKQLLTESVRLRLRADVPVGSCLSGGLDSSSIVTILNQILDGNGLQKTFSAYSNVEMFNEQKWVNIVTNSTKVDAHHVYPELDCLFDELPLLAWHQDEPFGSSSIYAQWNVFRLASENNVKVMLDGQGADEQLAGYNSYFGVRLASLLRSGEWGSFLTEAKDVKLSQNMSWKMLTMLVGNNLIPTQFAQLLRKLNGRSHIQPEWLDMKKLGAVPIDPLHGLQARGGSVTAVNRSQLMYTNLQKLLHWEDRCSMAHSIEARVPFLDYRLVEHVVGMPDAYKIKGGETKRVMREGMKNILPEPIRTRKDKLGFATPEEVWMKQYKPEVFLEQVKLAVEKSNGILKPEAINTTKMILTSQKPFSFLPWRFISFGAWLDAYF
ncbi:MAG: asparagine synthase (glutamine-hydrolyzing) [Gammaproteobacteria bacterium]|nr:asparagine synthase (glutamine-hydrolyzing) [Gammaproteobacteria bacterium]